jgi:hypothetical protein
LFESGSDAASSEGSYCEVAGGEETENRDLTSHALLDWPPELNGISPRESQRLEIDSAGNMPMRGVVIEGRLMAE